MTKGAKLLGHHIHPMLIVFPLGLLSTAVIFDIANIFSERDIFSLLAYWLLPAGLIGGILAASFGWIDWFAIPNETRAKTVGLVHGLINVGVLIVFFGSWMMRPSSLESPGLMALILSFSGLSMSLVGGWFGGELVQRLGISVHPVAHPNSPSSLSSSISAYKDVENSEANET